MTTTDARTGTATVPFRLPEPPERNIDEVTAFDYVYKTGGPINLLVHFGSPETTLVEADHWIVSAPGSRPLLVPDLLIAFDAEAKLYQDQNGYVISDQGKPPDFVLEVASPSTAERDVIYKRVEYARMGIPEYWRFDNTGESHGARLAGDRLVGGSYEPIPITEAAPNVLEGRSDALNLTLRWEDGELIWIDPATGQPLPGLVSEREARIEAEMKVERAEAQALSSADQAQRAEAQARRAEARVQELEAELRRLRERGD
jgi:Uma2 family endonuclease